MMRFYLKIYQAIILGLISLSAFAQENSLKNKILTFQQFTKEIIHHYPALKEQASRSQEIQAQKQIALSFRKPSAGLSFLSFYSNDPVTVFGTLLKQERFKESNFDIQKLNRPDGENQFQLGIEAEWVLFNAFQTLGAIRMTEALFQSSRDKEEALIQEACFLAYELTSQILLSQKIYFLTEKVMKHSYEDIRQAQELKEKGLILGADFFAAKSIASSLDQMLIASQNHIEQLKVAMNISRGFPWNTPFDLCPEIPSPSSPQSSLDQWIHSARDKHYGLASLRNLLHSREIELQKEKDSSLPRVSGFIQAEENTEKFSDFSDHYTLGIKATMDLFDPSRKPKILRLEESLNQMKQEEQKLLDQITLTLCQTFKDYQTFLKQLQASQKGYKDSEEALKLMEPLYREGKKSIKDLIEIRLLSLQDRIKMETFSAESALSFYKLLLAAGLLTGEQLSLQKET